MVSRLSALFELAAIKHGGEGKVAQPYQGRPAFTMLLLLTVFYVLRRGFALPIPVIEDRSASSCTDLNNCRTIWNIVWSCLVTTFACTWVAVHPNVPRPGQKANRHWYSRPLRRVRIMLYALIGPEFVLFWAWNQWKVATRKPTIRQLQGMLR